MHGAHDDGFHLVEKDLTLAQEFGHHPQDPAAGRMGCARAGAHQAYAAAAIDQPYVVTRQDLAEAAGRCQQGGIGGVGRAGIDADRTDPRGFGH